jgi:hypothetical protein
MNWYLSKIVYRIICGDGNHRAQFDEQLRLVHACDEISAFEHARNLGHREAESFLNDKQNLVRWEFINVCELYKISSFIDGAQLYSKIEEAENPEQYIAYVHGLAHQIRTSETLKHLKLL